MNNDLHIHQMWPLHSFSRKFCCAIILLLVFNAAYAAKTPAYKEIDSVLVFVKGKVTDSSGSPIVSASIVEKGTNNGTYTNGEGVFTMKVSTKDAVLSVSSIGYESKEVPLNGETDVEVVLKISQTSLNQVVVVGYGTKRKSDITGSIANINGDELKAAPITNVVQGLQGKVAGVQIINTSGAKPGGDITIRIRGYNSINSGNGPLYVINGFAGVGDLNTINPSDIASVDILKDASATAIYGARGANGVILITTKKGTIGKTTVNFDYSMGTQHIYKEYNLLNATEFADYVNTVRVAGGLSPIFNNPSIFGKGTDWQKELYKPAPVQNIQLSISGGDSKTKYAVSGGYFSQDGLEMGSGYNRGSLSMNLESELSQKFTMGAYVYAAETKNDMDNPAAASAALTISPIATVRDSIGKYMTNADLASIYGFQFYSKGNPIAMAKDIENITRGTHLMGNTYLTYKINKNLSLKTSFGSDISYGKYTFYIPNGTPDAGSINSGGTAQISTSKYVSWLNENTLTFDKNFENQIVNFVAGVTFQEMNSSNLTATAQGFTDDFYRYNNLGLGSVQMPSGSSTDSWFLNSYFVRGNYQLFDKYLATFTTRVDGSSKFGTNNKYGFFPSGALAWKISKEPFLQNLKSLSNLKLRVSYGLTGNQDIGSFQSLASIEGRQYIIGNSRAVGAVPVSIANKNLKWEKTAQFDFGIDMGFFDERLSFTADYYKKITSDLLLAKPVPYSSGFSTSLQNVGRVSNTGFEFSVNSVNIQKKNLQWTTGFNISFNKNRVLDLGDANEIISNGYLWYFGDYSIARVGYPIGMFYNYKFDGIWQVKDNIANSAQPNAKPGDAKFVDQNKDGVINSNDRVMIGNPHPDFIFGLSSKLSWKGFDLEVLVNGSYGNDIMNESYIDIKFPNASTNITHDAYYNRWAPDNNSNTHIRPGSNIDPSSSSMYLEDGSYLRINNVLLGYNLPQTLLNKVKINKVRFYISAQNLYTFTKYSGYNPEANTYGADNLRLGYDYSYYPQARTFNLGLNLTF